MGNDVAGLNGMSDALTGNTLSLLSGIGQGLDSLAGFGFDIANMIFGLKNYKTQQEYAAWNRDLSERQFKMSQDIFNYQKEENNLMREREDNAVQRRVADLKAAGLNPVLAAGAAASSSVGLASGSAGGSQVSAPKMDKFEKTANAMAVLNAIQEQKKLNAEIALTKAEAQSRALDNTIKPIARMKALMDADSARIDRDLKKYEYKKTLKTGISKGGSSASDMAREAINSTENLLESIVGGAKSAGTKVLDTSKSVGTKVADTAKSTGTKIKSGASKTWKKVKSGAKKSWNWVNEKIDDFYSHY